jgi:2-polyprenyl-3-methyl-5-hydroxy-6-metoxy-1,4-benzoquinol methylase
MKATNTYDQLAEQYEAYISGRNENDLSGDPCAAAFFGVIGKVGGLRVLDAGCGEGFVARALASKGAIVTGVDVSPKLVEKAQLKNKGSIEYFVADLSEPLPHFAEHFDLVASFFVLNDVPDYQGFISTLGSVTKPGGRAVLLLNNPYSAVLRKKADTYFESGTSRRYFVGVYHYHQTMGEYIKAFSACGFLLRTLLEPAPGPNEPEERRTGWVQVPFIIVLEFVKFPS